MKNLKRKINGPALKAAMALAEIKVKDMAEILDISASSVISWRNGRPGITRRHEARIVNVLRERCPTLKTDEIFYY